jgi:predicted RNA-binding Zn-ribbon protein involved in translation (DUF1610 family)
MDLELAYDVFEIRRLFMFCSNCGTQLRDGVKFCSNCGNAVGSNSSQQVNRTISPLPYTHMVAAKCTNCGSALTVDSNLKKAVCPYCKFTYIVDQAINNYNISVTGNLQIANATINVQGQDKNVLLARGKEFEEQKKYKTALEYYNKVLDLDINNADARIAIERVEKARKNYIYLETSAYLNRLIPGIGYWPSKGVLFLAKGVLGFTNGSKLVDAYNVNKISDLNKKNINGNWNFVFKYPDKIGTQRFEPCDASVDLWINTIQNAQKGIYPNEE